MLKKRGSQRAAPSYLHSNHNLIPLKRPLRALSSHSQNNHNLTTLLRTRRPLRALSSYLHNNGRAFAKCQARPCFLDEQCRDNLINLYRNKSFLACSALYFCAYTCMYSRFSHSFLVAACSFDVRCSCIPIPMWMAVMFPPFRCPFALLTCSACIVSRQAMKSHLTLSCQVLARPCDTRCQYSLVISSIAISSTAIRSQKVLLDSFSSG